MLTRRRIGIASAVAVLAACVFGALAWHLWLPSEIRARVSEAASRRGLRASVGSVDVGLEGLVLRGVELEGAQGALRFRIGELEADAGLWALVTEGSSSIRVITLRQVHVAGDLDSRALPRALARLRGQGSAEAEGARRRSIRAEGVRITLRDREGTLARIAGGEILVDADGSVELSAGPIELAPGAEDGARAERAQARVVRERRALRVSRLSFGSLAIRYRERDGVASSPLWGRVRDHARRLAPREDRAPRRDGEESESDAAAGALVTRAREVLGPRLTADALLEVDDLSVVASSSTGEQTVLRDLEARVRSLPGDRFALEGSGRPGRGGRLGWRLEVDPEELRAEGRIDFQQLPFVLLAPVLPSLPWHRPEDARLTGELSIEGVSASLLRLDGQVSVEELAVSSPRIAPRPVQHLRLGIAGQADWNPLTRRLEIERATVALGDASVHVSGSLEWPEDHYLIDVQATLPPTACNVAVGAIPADLLAEMAGFTFSGQIGGRVRTRIDSRDLASTTLDVRVADACRFETAPALADVRRFRGPFTHRVLEPDGTTFEMESGPGTASWTPIRDVSPFLVHAVLGHEDGGFFQHHGFADHAIQLALVRNLQAGRYVYGASTITMQLVKNVFLRREKTLARKVQEVLLTWWVESVMTKEQILELYLNVIEYGPGVYGIRNAAQHYFGRAPDELGPAESAYLATILPNPKAYHSHWVGDQLPDAFRRRVTRFLQTLGARRRYTADAVALGLEQLGRFDFYHPGEPRPAEPERRRGGTAPLPFGLSLDRAWEEAVGPDDPGAENEAQPEDWGP